MSLRKTKVVVIVVVSDIDIVIDANGGSCWWCRRWLRSIG